MNVSKFLKKHSATILSVVSAAGVVITALTTAKATLKADKLIKEAKEEKDGELTKVEVFKTAAPVYAAPTVMGALTIGCIFGANVLNKRQQAMLTSAYAVVHRAYGDYKNQVKAIYGEEAHKEILQKIAVEKSNGTPIYAPTFCNNCCLDFDDSDEEERLFYDSFSERYFQSTFSKVLQAEYHLNRNFALGGGVCLNDFYDFLGIASTDEGEVLGWSVYTGINWIDFNHGKATLDDGLECFIIEAAFDPYTDYDGEGDEIIYADQRFSEKDC